MKITFVTGDLEIIDIMQSSTALDSFPKAHINQVFEPLELVSEIIASKPNLLVLDDDLVHPHSTRVLKAVSSMLPNLSLIFLTSVNSVELGREISPLGVDYYGIKPLEPIDFEQAIACIIKDKSQNLLNV